MRPYRVIAIVTVSLLLFLPAAAAADDARPVTVQMSTDGTLVVVADPGHNALSFFRVAGSEVSLLARRDLAGDVAAADEKAAPAAAAPPTKDVPGDDPPGFPRPKRSVRVATSYTMDSAVQDTWDTSYWIPGSVEDVYAALRAALKSWKIKEAAIGTRSVFPRGDLHAVDGPTDLKIDVRRSAELPEWSVIQVHEVRKRG